MAESKRKLLKGVVIRAKANKTVVVEVSRTFRHPKYDKVMKASKKYAVHDENNTCKVGDVVDIYESRPISKTKVWCVLGSN